MGLFKRNKKKNFTKQVWYNDPIEFLGSKKWEIKSNGFSEDISSYFQNSRFFGYIITLPLFMNCDMILDLTTSEEYKLVQVGSILTEIVIKDGSIEHYHYEKLPILKLVRFNCDLSTIDSYKECRNTFPDVEISKVGSK